MISLAKAVSCCTIAVAVFLSAHAQNYPNVGIQADHSYSNSNIDHIDLGTGNVVGTIPLISYDQLGHLSPLSFSINFNSAAWYTQETCDSYSDECLVFYTYPMTTTSALGAQVTSNFVGAQLQVNAGIVEWITCTDVDPCSVTYAQRNMSILDETGASHPLIYDFSNPYWARAADGSGYALYAVGAEDPFNSQNWFTQVTGTMYTPTGNTIQGNLTNTSWTETDPAGNALTLGYPYGSYGNGNPSPYAGSKGYSDSIGRLIPDPTTALLPAQTSVCPNLGDANQPVVYAGQWNAPGPGGGTIPYIFCYSGAAVQTQFFNVGDPGGCAPLMQYWGSYADDTVFNQSTIGQPNGYSEGFCDTLTYFYGIQSVVLPNGAYWGFLYDAGSPYNCDYGTCYTESYGTVKEIQLPTGAKIDYSYTNLYPTTPPALINSRVVSSRTVTDALGNQVTNSFTYSMPSLGEVVAKETRAGNDILHTFQDGVHESKTQWFQGNTSGTLIKQVDTAYPSPTAAANSFPVSVTTSTPAGVISIDTKQYLSGFSGSPYTCAYHITDEFKWCTPDISATSPGVYLNQIAQEAVYDGNGNLLGTTINTPIWTQSAAYKNVNQLGLIASIQVLDGDGNQVALTNYTFDSGSSSNPLGNQTSVSRWLNTSSLPVVTETSYNAQAMPTQITDGNGNVTRINSYQCNGLYPESVTAPYGSMTTSPETRTQQLDCNTGFTQSSTDPNGVTTAYEYNDPLGRITKMRDAVNTPQESWTTYSYPSMNQTNIAQDEYLAGDGAIQSGIMLNGLGQTIQQRNPNGSVVITQYNNIGEVQSVTNPYFSPADQTYGATNYTYDALGRKTIQLEPGNSNAKLQWCYDGIATTGQSNCRPNMSSFISAEWVDQADESGNDTQASSDALGHLRAVVESSGLSTSYSYDALGNLSSVYQAGSAPDAPVSRGFDHDSLSRLITATNPESGAASYTYDANGNVITKTSAAQNGATGTVTLGYCYDALNRMTFKFYLPSTTPPNCPSSNAATYPSYAVAAYKYDAPTSSGVSYPLGRLAAEVTLNGGVSVSQHLINAYDAVGHVTSEQQCPVGTCYTLSYGYNLAGKLTSSTNGIASGANAISMGFGYDDAARLTSVVSPAAGGAGATTLFQAPPPNAQLPTLSGYGPAGLLNAAIGGPWPSAPITTARNYDARMRPVSETDTGKIQVTPGSESTGTITVSGTEHQAMSATPGRVALYVQGGIPRKICLLGSSTNCISISHKSGSLALTINGFTATANYDSDPGTTIVATALVAALNAFESPVVASNNSGTSSTIIITSKATGAASNYPFTFDFDGMDLACPVGPAFALAGGADATLADSGTVVVAVNNIPSSPVVSWGPGSTAASLASALEQAIQTAVGGSAPPNNLVAVNYAAGSASFSLTSQTAGVSTDYPISITVNDATPGVATPSFSVMATSPLAPVPVTAATMTGGTNPVTSAATVYSYNLAGDYAPNGNLNGYTDSVMGTWTFGYDNLNRLTNANGPSQSPMTYAYDSFGNRWPQGMTRAQADTAGYTFSNNQQPVWTGTAYDAAGNVIASQSPTGGSLHYQYDNENRLISVNNSTSYLYDAEGRRVGKGAWAGGIFQATNQYLYGANGGQITELDGSGNWIHSNVYAGNKLLATYSAAGIHYHLSDWLGTRRVQVSGSGPTAGEVEEQCQSLPFGDNQVCAGPDAAEQHFTGKERDTESGLDYFGARYYASNMGRFMNPDPLGFHVANNADPQSWNFYSYALNNPLRYFDPTGYYSCDPDTWDDRTNTLTAGHCHFDEDDFLQQRSTQLIPLQPLSDNRGLMLRYLRSCEGHAPGGGYGAYNDSMGFCTAGYGQLLHQSPCTADDIAAHRGDTQAQSEAQLEHNYDTANQYVQDNTTSATEGQRNAFVDQVFNMGVGKPGGQHGTINHTAWKDFVSGNNSAVPADILSLGAGGRGIHTRRLNEVNMFTDDTVPASCFTVSGNGG